MTLSLLSQAVDGQSKHSLGGHRLRASGIPGGRTRTAASKAAFLGNQGRGWQCSSLSKMLQSNAREKLALGIFLSQR